MSAGVTPETLLACPRFSGLTRLSFSSASFERPGTEENTRFSGIFWFSCFAKRFISFWCLSMYPLYFISDSKSYKTSSFSQLARPVFLLVVFRWMSKMETSGLFKTLKAGVFCDSLILDVISFCVIDLASSAFVLFLKVKWWILRDINFENKKISYR